MSAGISPHLSLPTAAISCPSLESAHVLPLRAPPGAAPAAGCALMSGDPVHDPASWLERWPDIAALLAGGLGVIIRASTADGPRPLRAVVADTAVTISLGWLVFRGAIGAGVSADLAFGLAGFTGALGWEWARRRFMAAASRRER